MTDTTKVSEATEPPLTGTAHSDAKEAGIARRRRLTVIVVTIGFVLIAALVLLMVTRPPVEDARPTSLGFSFNSFMRWLGDLNPILQIPIVLVVFFAVVGIILLLIEYAPRPGKFYFWLRLVTCFAIPVLAFMLLRPYQNAVIYVIGIAVLLGALLFWADYRAREGAGHLYQLMEAVAIDHRLGTPERWYRRSCAGNRGIGRNIPTWPAIFATSRCRFPCKNVGNSASHVACRRDDGAGGVEPWPRLQAAPRSSPCCSSRASR